LSASVPLDVLLLDLQSDILNYLVQESLAHAALIFATLAAAFTFAAGFRRRLATGPLKVHDLLRNRFRLIYFVVLSALFFVTIYAFFRFFFYANITSFLLWSAAPPSKTDSLGSYYRTVINQFEARQPSFLLWFSGMAGIGWVGFALAILFGLIASLLVTYLASSGSAVDSSQPVLPPT
jgi:hypothetical protein